MIHIELLRSSTPHIRPIHRQGLLDALHEGSQHPRVIVRLRTLLSWQRPMRNAAEACATEASSVGRLETVVASAARFNRIQLHAQVISTSVGHGTLPAATCGAHLRRFQPGPIPPRSDRPAIGEERHQSDVGGPPEPCRPTHHSDGAGLLGQLQQGDVTCARDWNGRDSEGGGNRGAFGQPFAPGAKVGQPAAAPLVCGPSSASHRQHPASIRPHASRIAGSALNLRCTNAPTAPKPG